MKLSQELEERGYINQISGPELAVILDGEQRTIYHGIDPSADSAHAGNFVNWMLLKHLVGGGHKIVFLVGGATGLIGDPKPDAERQLKDPAEVELNVEKLKQQAEDFFGVESVEFVNNLDWFANIKLLDFLRDIGKHYTVNELIKKDAISTRLQGDSGLSYTEFAYPLIQGYDFYQLYKEKGCTVQVGGSDQWGNIISGVELVRRKTGAEVYAITVPLIVDKATGKKFGKSEGNAVWLDSEKTSPYQFYQFWFNVSDDGVVDYLKLYSFYSLEEIADIQREFELNPGNRYAQKKLAYAVTSLVHNEEVAKAAAHVSDILFGGDSLDSLTATEKQMLLETAPTSDITKETLLIDVLVSTNLATSKREARTFVESGAVSINGQKITDVEAVISNSYKVEGLVLLKRGKKQLHILNMLF